MWAHFICQLFFFLSFLCFNGFHYYDFYYHYYYYYHYYFTLVSFISFHRMSFSLTGAHGLWLVYPFTGAGALAGLWILLATRLFWPPDLHFATNVVKQIQCPGRNDYFWSKCNGIFYINLTTATDIPSPFSSKLANASLYI